MELEAELRTAVEHDEKMGLKGAWLRNKMGLKGAWLRNIKALLDTIATLRSDNERLAKERDAAVRAVIKHANDTAPYADELGFEITQRMKAEAVQVGEMRDVLATMGFGDDLAKEKIGWRGLVGISKEHFVCEFCGREHLDCTEIPHKEGCPILRRPRRPYQGANQMKKSTTTPVVKPRKPRKAFFCYERTLGKWHPVIYYDEVPISTQGKENIPDRSPIYDISNAINSHGEVGISFIQLSNQYPSPDDLLKKSIITDTQKQMETKMPQPVTGFLSAQGQFFETIEAANLFEARYALQQATTAAVIEMLNSIGQVEGDVLAKTVDDTINFVNDNEELIFRYIVARQAIAEGEKRRNALVGSATTSNSAASEDIRHDPDPNVDRVVSTEAATAALGNEN